MNNKEFTKKLSENYKEIVAQIIIHVILFVFYSYGQEITYPDGQEEKSFLLDYKISFFLNYATASFVINYFLLPTFYYKKKFLKFFIGVLLVLILIILIDEFVLEQIYFPDTRGAYFPGLFFTILETLPLIIIFLVFKLAWDFNQKQSEIEQLKLLVKDSELQFLKSQINPHFLFNNLNNLYAYATENSPKTPSIILKLSSVLRYMLYDCKENFVLLSKEIEHLKHYTALNELQIEDRGEILFTTNIGHQTEFLIAPLILNVFIENAFKHSTASQSSDIKIDINVNINDKGILTFTCENSFLTYQNTQNLSKGIGLLNVKKRLGLIYPNSHILDIEKTENNFKVFLLIHLKPHTQC